MTSTPGKRVLSTPGFRKASGTRFGSSQGKKNSRTDATSESKPLHVQVYRLSNNKQVGLKLRQFPPGLPHPTPVVRTTIEVSDKEVVGTVYYQDGSSASDKRQLDADAVKCPEIP